ncbi:aspartyl-phosphate phosphatase Spo0E family protein [Paenibacillus sp. MER TA 81-3]|uniref:aspartyl-phosphate phosphatase Spo0E family protein n=1 Tax=Paenibacillus sp. MER TA 81-3 TaxID=2939573 RepID=UPI00203DC7C4|nr:aspartyl-phosphate phosphatase Spo0E family protein [Paenibacillus sp. MER TA 81-3]MCM3338804.1 aspartyl-phosphate phosphatase Spo0E family protein [Paenibacillus sp. MER TA 81-3]
MNIAHLSGKRTQEALMQTIERIRRELVQAVNEKKSFTDDEIVKLSQQLDDYLVTVQRETYAKWMVSAAAYTRTERLDA